MRRGGPVPLYYQLLQILRARIGGGEYVRGAPLPTDEALMKEFGVSRHTVRSALHQLVAEGLVERFPGRGSFIVEGGARPSPWSIEAVEDLIETSFVDTYTVFETRLVEARVDGRAAVALGAAPTERLFRVRSVRSATAGPYAYSNVFFPADIGAKLPRHLFSERPLILLVEEYCSLPAFRTRQVALAAAADREAARRLHVAIGAPLLVLERTYYSRDGRPIEHTRNVYRPDRYEQVVTFLRRQDTPWEASAASAFQRSRGGSHVRPH
ncbi:MAG: GntR family transcriptional regulator [Candidatus Rokuibacteriota bacterium]